MSNSWERFIGRTTWQPAAPRPRPEVLELPPFTPPADYAFEPELTGPTPRPIPASIHDGLWDRWGREVFHLWSGGALLCAVLALIPAVRAAQIYVPPIRLLPWIAVVLAVVAVAQWLSHRYSSPPTRYLQHGVPLVGRILRLVKAPYLVTRIGQPESYCIHAEVDFLHPHSGKHVMMEFSSASFPADQRHLFDTTYREGDYATLVCLPEDFSRTVQLYGFLNLVPNLGLIKLGRQTMLGRALTMAALALGIVALFLGTHFTLQSYEPLQATFMGQYWPPALAGAVVLGGGFGVFLLWSTRQERNRQHEWNRRAVQEKGAQETGPASWFDQPDWGNRVKQGAALLGLLGMGGLGGITLAMWGNAALDHGPPRPIQVTVHSLRHETDNHILAAYVASYSVEGDPEKTVHKFYTDPTSLAALGTGRRTAILRPGRLGWPWVETILPPEATDP